MRPNVATCGPDFGHMSSDSVRISSGLGRPRSKAVKAYVTSGGIRLLVVINQYVSGK